MESVIFKSTNTFNSILKNNFISALFSVIVNCHRNPDWYDHFLFIIPVILHFITSDWLLLRKSLLTNVVRFKTVSINQYTPFAPKDLGLLFKK